jgi:hypothetical protein
MPDHDTRGPDPVESGLETAHYAHLLSEFAGQGSSAHTFAQEAGHLASEGEEIFSGEASLGTVASSGVSTGAGLLAVPLGLMQGYEGVEHMRHGDTGHGAVEAAQGTIGAAGGMATLAGVMGCGAAGAAAPVLSAAAGGIGVGRYGDEEAQRLGLAHDEHGHAESMSDWAGDRGAAADDWVSQHTHSSALGTIAGLGTTAAASIPAALGAVGSAGVGAASAIGHGLSSLWHAL